MGYLYTLKSGRAFTANKGILGLGPDLVLHEGFDGALEWDEMEEPFTAAERKQIAEIMIARWQAWRDKVSQ